MGKMIVCLGSLIPGTDKLRQLIKPSVSNIEIRGDYDLFLICGLQFNVFQILPLYREFRAEAFAKDSRTPLSDECFVRCLQGFLGGTLAVEMIAKLRQITSASIALIPQPLPGEQLDPSLVVGNVRDDRGEESVAELFDTACRRLAHDLDVQIVFQPMSTKSAPLHTKAVYSAGTVRFRDFQPRRVDHKFTHMNGDYGLVVLREALSSLDIGKRSSAGKL
jgi:hypothetical protein